MSGFHCENLGRCHRRSHVSFASCVCSPIGNVWATYLAPPLHLERRGLPWLYEIRTKYKKEKEGRELVFGQSHKRAPLGFEGIDRQHRIPCRWNRKEERFEKGYLRCWPTGFFRSSSSPQLLMTIGTLGRSFSSVGTSVTFGMTSSYPRISRPNTTCLPGGRRDQ